MKPLCRILLIEDDHAEAQAIERACCPDPATAAIDVVSNAADAEDALLEGEYDLVVCDLALPSDDRRLEPAAEEGLRLFQLIRERSQGTPVIVLSGHADLHMMQRFFQANRNADLYGTRTEHPLVQFFPKEDLPDCVDAVQSHIARTGVLDQLELELPSGMSLSLSEQRALKIYGRRTGASRGVIERLDGGLSDSRTFKVSFTDAAGDGTGAAVAKVGDLHRVTREASRYEQVAARLPVGLGALVLFTVDAGAGRKGALLYQLADEYTRSLFDLLTNGNGTAVKVVERLQERLAEWTVDAPVAARSLVEMRRPLISDIDVRAAGVSMPDERNIEVSVRDSMVHGDLHGLNILVNSRAEPTLIDYGEVRRANAALDPVTLELSIVFHPAMEGQLGSWPTEEQAGNWADIDTWCEGCPVEAFVRACREWATAVAASEAELLATAYAYSLRQMKYGNPTQQLALRVADGTLSRLTA